MKIHSYSFAVCTLLSMYALPITAFQILPQTAATSKLGYGNWYIDTDGELNLMKYLLKPGAVVLDVGGNIGEWSLAALKVQPTIQLHSFEPLPSIHEQLKTALDAYKNVQTHNIALSDQQGQAEFFFYCNPPQDCGLSGFYYREVLKGDKNHGEPVKIVVEQNTVDNFCAQHGIVVIDFLKIDTEGAELRILQGAQEMLKNHCIRALQFEYGGCYVDAKTTLYEVMQLLTKHGYVIFRIIPQGLVHIARWESTLENFNLSNYCALRSEDYPHHKLVKFE